VMVIGGKAAGTAGGGGWAGDRSAYDPAQPDGENYGQCIYADWDARWIVTRTNSPCGLDGGYGFGRIPWVADLGMSTSFMHEITHGFNMDSHNPVIFPPADPCTQAQKDQYMTLNPGFIYMRSVPVDTPPPPPPPH